MAAPTPKELLLLAVAAIQNELSDGESPAGAISRRTGEPYQNVSRWMREANGPSYEGAMRILDSFGWISIPEDVRELAALPPTPLEEIAGSLATILDLEQKILELLERALQVPQAERDEDRPTRRPKK